MMQREGLSLLTAAGLAPDENAFNQWALSVQALINSALNQTPQNIVAAATTDLGSKGTNILTLTGNATINSFGASASLTKPLYFVAVTGTPTLHYAGATPLGLPGFADIICAPGDTFIARYQGAGNWQVIAYFRAAARPPSWSLGASGYDIASSGRIEQWGITASKSQDDGVFATNFPLHFPTLCTQIQLTLINPLGGSTTDNDQTIHVVSWDQNGFNALVQAMGAASSSVAWTACWRAIGY
jgi:hypothetical protein